MKTLLPNNYMLFFSLFVLLLVKINIWTPFQCHNTEVSFTVVMIVLSYIQPTSIPNLTCHDIALVASKVQKNHPTPNSTKKHDSRRHIAVWIVVVVITKSKRAMINNKTASELYTKEKSRCSDKDVNSCTSSYQKKKMMTDQAEE